MRNPALLTALAWAALSLVACGGQCKLSSQCGEGERCDFTTETCVKGCQSAADCAPTARCDPEFGQCIPTRIFRRDLGVTDGSTGTPDAGTATTSDAG